MKSVLVLPAIELQYMILVLFNDMPVASAGCIIVIGLYALISGDSNS